MKGTDNMQEDEDAGRFSPRGDYKLVSTYASLVDRMYFLGKQGERYFRERDFIDISMRSLASGAKIIDAGCGTGIHIQLLRELGYDISGFDLREDMVAVAKERNRSSIIVQGDMREFPLGMQVDGVICMYGAINYVETEEGILKTFSNFFNHLNSGGIAIVDTREWCNLDERVRVWHTEGYTLAKRWVKSSRLMESVYRVFFTIPSEGVMEMEDHWQYFQDSTWLKLKMFEAGFSLVNVFDNYNLRTSFRKETGSHLPVLLAQKK